MSKTWHLRVKFLIACSSCVFLYIIRLKQREAEENLAGLATKEGVDIILQDVFSKTKWPMKYRFWANQKGNIYLLDQCGKYYTNSFVANLFKRLFICSRCE